jgi:hypothetical protein
MFCVLFDDFSEAQRQPSFFTEDQGHQESAILEKQSVRWFPN